MGVEKPSWERNLWGNATNFKRHLLDKNQMNTIFKNLIWWQNRLVSVIIKTIVTFWCKVMSTGNNQVSRLGTVKHSKLPWNRIGRDLSFHMRINSLNAAERRQPIFFPPSKQLETSLQEAIFLLIHFLVCACLCYQVFQQLIYSLHVVPSEKKKKKKRQNFPKGFMALEIILVLHLSCTWRSELKGSISFIAHKFSSCFGIFFMRL